MLLGSMKGTTKNKKTAFQVVLAVFLFLLIIWYPWQTPPMEDGRGYNLYPDSPTYMRFGD